jgi:hypothetical protein
MTEMTAAGLAYKAAEIMSERGHCKGRLHDEQGRVCFNGALLAVTGNGFINENAFSSVFFTAEQILAERGFPPYWNAVSYNNDPDTTGEDVILLLKETGKRLEQ